MKKLITLYKKDVKGYGEMKTDIKVGKYTLESLTTGMYNDPKITYREYIQNAVDSLEEAVRVGIINKEETKIEILIDSENDKISIYDNGLGIISSRAYSILTNIGNSTKRHSMNRGFRGIGRLGGLSYCNNLKFITSYKGENIKSIIEFDCKRLRQLLVPGEYENYDLAQVINEVTSYIQEEEQNENHYFTVEMSGIDSFCGLLDIDNVRSYIKQIAPLPYKKFIWRELIHKMFKDIDLDISEFNIYLGESKENLTQLFKPNRDKFEANIKSKEKDEIKNIETFKICDDKEDILVIGWYGNCDFYGGITNKELSGLRARKGNILIGDDKLLNNIFKEGRFNSWVQGEIFVISDKLIPNARRDDFEQNESYFNLIDKLRVEIGEPISKLIRDSSKNRNNPLQKKITEAKKKVVEVSATEEKGFNSKVEKTKYTNDIEKFKKDIEKIKPKTKEEEKEKENVIKELVNTIEKVDESNNYKTNKIKDISKKERKILCIITDILSEYIVDKDTLDEIVDRIDEEIAKGGKKR
ncbi:ATP-binding protein [Paraclostridium sordellii]|uniref:ATP-binding protein n=1 Tax=Paraclostridium sordellii TaxID=1505 RepID=UPI001C614CB7|nr:hypothetical protein [Paeniclostridium sordellii]QYE99102.1 hypothetical protein KZ987_06220 [Paeniclostridium sordellii]